MRFVVLRDLSTTRVVSPFDGQSRAYGQPDMTWANTIAPPEPRIDVEDTDLRGRSELARDPGVAAVAHEMPVKLIHPLGATDAPLGDVWGIDAVGAATSSRSGAGTVVAVLDTGVDRSHAAFDGVDVVEEDFSATGNGDR